MRPRPGASLCVGLIPTRASGRFYRELKQAVLKNRLARIPVDQEGTSISAFAFSLSSLFFTFLVIAARSMPWSLSGAVVFRKSGGSFIAYLPVK